MDGSVPQIIKKVVGLFMPQNCNVMSRHNCEFLSLSCKICHNCDFFKHYVHLILTTSHGFSPLHFFSISKCEFISPNFDFIFYAEVYLTFLFYLRDTGL